MTRDIAYLRTARLFLRPIRPEDAPALVAGAGNYDVSRWLAVVPFPYTIEDARNFVASRAAEPRVVWAICDGPDRPPCGLISLDRELGYWFAREAWGKGYAVEAGDAVIDAGFADPTRSVIRATSMVSNTRSRNVLAKLGLRDTGESMRHFRALGQDAPVRTLEMTRGEWVARRRYRLRTRRLALRELRESDLPGIHHIATRPEVAPMLSSVPVPWPDASARRWFERSRYRGRPGFRAAILRRGRLVGTVGMGAATGGGPFTAMWFVDPARWGRGYATEAASAFLADTMDRFGIDTLRADHFADNPASGRVMDKLGFVRSGSGTGTSAARLEAAAIVVYRLDRANLKVRP